MSKQRNVSRRLAREAALGADKLRRQADKAYPSSVARTLYAKARALDREADAHCKTAAEI